MFGWLMYVLDDSTRNAIYATLFTWFVTAAGAALVFVLPDDEQSTTRLKPLLDGLLGFAGGVMVAASYFSLLAPAVEAAKVSETWSSFPALPVVLGFALGGGSMAGTDVLLGKLGLDENGALDLMRAKKEKGDDDDGFHRGSSSSLTTSSEVSEAAASQLSRDTMVRRRPGGPPGAGVFDAMQRTATGMQRSTSDMERGPESPVSSPSSKSGHVRSSSHGGGGAGKRPSNGKSEEGKDGGRWRRIYMLVIAITLHNFPEGLAVGVGFGSAGVLAAKSHSAASATAATAAAPVAPNDAPEAAHGIGGDALAPRIHPVKSSADMSASESIGKAAGAHEESNGEALAAATASYAGARSLAIGIALQNFPEGLAVSGDLQTMPTSPLYFFRFTFFKSPFCFLSIIIRPLHNSRPTSSHFH
jgi:zinc transporter 11